MSTKDDHRPEPAEEEKEFPLILTTPLKPIKTLPAEEKEEEECRTPTSEEHKITKVLCCPPAPRKPRVVESCKRRIRRRFLPERSLEFHLACCHVSDEELDGFFGSFYEVVNGKRKRPRE